MRYLSKLAVALVAMAGMSACTTWESVNEMQTTGTDFQKALHAEYLKQSKLEIDEEDWWNAKYYWLKAERAGMGETVLPTDFSDRSIAPDKMDGLDAARADLMAALDGGARERMPTKAAECQGYFECWAEESDEGHQPNDIKFCRDNFDACMGQLAVKPAPVAAPEPAPAPAPEPAVEMVAGPFKIYFGFDSAALDAEAMAEIDRIVEAYKKTGGDMVVQAYTDTSGNVAYNRRLAERRAQAVVDELSKYGLQKADVRAEAFGEANPEVATGDNVRERRNRRAVVRLVYVR